MADASLMSATNIYIYVTDKRDECRTNNGDAPAKDERIATFSGEQCTANSDKLSLTGTLVLAPDIRANHNQFTVPENAQRWMCIIEILQIAT
jgi:hypothetical protein